MFPSTHIRLPAPPARPAPTIPRVARAVILCSALAFGLAGTPAIAATPDMPGEGISVQPLQSSLPEESFQTYLVTKALQQLGYKVQPIKEIEYATGLVAIANGDATFLADYWVPLHQDFYKNAGGEASFYSQGTYSSGAVQGYLIDKKTADAYGITNLAQLRDPQIAKLFDSDGDGRANLTGCNPGWGCEGVIETQLDAYGLRATVSHDQGSYPALMADTIERYKHGQPVLYYTWMPYWVSSVLKPGEDVVWLEVPFSATPGKPGDRQATRLPDGKDYGFVANTQHILANRKFAEANPAAAKLFEVMEVPVADINAQNLRMREGENKAADIERHADGWIAAHQTLFDGWLQQARAAAGS